MDEPEGVNTERSAGRGRPRLNLLGLSSLVVLGLMLFGWRLGGHDLWPTDEPRFGLVAREMWQRGDHVVLSLNNALYTEKPPLFFWAVNLCAWFRGGVDESASRLPSAVAGVLALLLIARLGRRLYDRETGWLAAVVFATSAQILERARWASIDMTLNLFVLSAILLLWEGAVAESGERWRVPLGWGAMGLATLAKGPVGLLLPLLAVLPAFLLRRDWRGLRRVVSPWGALLFLTITIAWFGPFAARIGVREALGILTHQTVERYVNAWNGQQPVWYYFVRFPIGFFPWVVFLPWALRDALSRERPLEERRASLFLACWAAAIFVFFTFSTGKRGVYIIPLYPAVSLLVARFLKRAAPGHPESRSAGRLRAAARTWCVIGALLGGALLAVGSRRYPDLRTAAWCLGVMLVLAALLPWMARWRSSAIALAPAALMTGVLLVATESVLPWANGYLNLRGFSERARVHLRPEVPLAATEEKREAWIFYTGRFLTAVNTPPEILEYLAGPPPRDLIIEQELYERLRGQFPPGVREVTSGQVSGHPYYLLRREGG